MALSNKLIGVAVIWDETGKILIDKRRLGDSFGGLWEFPGGKKEAGETIENCIKREVLEELGIEVAVEKHLITIEYNYSEIRLILHVYHCRYLRGIPKAIECDEFRWVTLDEIDRFTFPEANEQIITALKKI
ncbi:mutator MutT protein [Trichodesmium erythraeum IMS101]|uniref:8-oxo-dGTP diphosphatase n=1 Tax=Trichodesmium erythraeum (strain IMS101) TaxID=203124 RepID=Q10XF6_TRIEI|nr:8-oxo-dGTP diphosphatase MutT [Trichodesmium erythraeum GBRTRLIN201]MCH2048063.1 8-oxo-dGTP diphosphatase MutT [Trichodesmium sp. ALOHA_ZT_67]MCL2928788.1 8-oxo-dGTP diphosphatase MutT [Trichodesmium sp. MAG_R01]MDT9339088.1 8-oxo-dGTP diphosphatase MutT [Trichodesmium erythraeum 21-75]